MPLVAQREQRELTPEERARAASSIATNLEHAHGAVVSALESLWHAHDARDRPGYLKARQAAENAIQRVRELASGARAHALDASDPAARAKLEQAEALVEVEEKNLAAAPAAPAPVAPVLRMEAALLSALPPLVIEGSRKEAFDTARHATAAVLYMLPFSDVQALELILREFPEHPLAIRIRRFENPNTLLAIIKDPKVRARARAMEPAMPKAAAPPPAFTTPTLIAAPAAFVPAAEAPSIESASTTAAPQSAAPKESPDEIARRESLLDLQATAYAGELLAESSVVDSGRGHHAFLNTLDRIDDPLLRAKVAEKFQQLSGGQSLEEFIKAASWAGKRDKDMALDLISDKRGAAEQKLAAMEPAKRKELRTKANQWAQQVLAATSIDDANDDANAQKIARVLGPRTPEEIEAIRAAIRTNTAGHHALYEEVDRSLSGGNEDEAVAGMSGDPMHAALVGLQNADGDPPRVKEILRGLKPEQLSGLRMQSWILALVPEGVDRDEVHALIEGRRDAADAARISHLLKRPKEGGRIDTSTMQADEETKRNMEERKAENVLKELEAKTPAELIAARDAWDKDPAHAGHTFEDMLDERFGEGYSVEKLRIGALLNGDRATDKVLQLRQGMRTHDQQAIEDALANPDLKSADPVKKATAEKERERIVSEAKAIDATEQRVTAAASGRASDGVQGRDIRQQLDASYEASVDDPRLAESFRERVMIANAPEVGRDKREADAKERRTAAGEVLEHGELSVETQVYRADKKGDKQTEAQIVEGIESGKLKETEARFQARYGKDMLDEPQLAKYAYVAEMAKAAGDERPIEEIERELARGTMNANELRIENVREYGVKADRRADVQHRLQQELADKQHSSSLDDVESRRAFWGGNLGTEELVREQLAAEDNLLAPAKGPFGTGPRDLKAGVDKAEFQEIDQNLTGSLDVQREEKTKLANHISKIFMTIVKLAAFAAAQPELFAWIDILGGMANIAIKKQIAGEAYDPTEDAKLLAITAAVDIATAGISRYGRAAAEGEQALAAVGSEAWKHTANLAVASAGIVASGIVVGRSPTDILGDIVKGGLTQFLPQRINQRVMAAIGDGTRARALLAEIAGMAAEIKTNTAINGGDSVTDAVVMALGTRLHSYLSSRAPSPAGVEESPRVRELPETSSPPEEDRAPAGRPDEQAASEASQTASVAQQPATHTPSSPDGATQINEGTRVGDGFSRTTPAEQLPASASSVSQRTGEAIASKVPGSRYEAGGVFKLATEKGEVTVRVRRTAGETRILHQGRDVVLEIPHGTDDATLSTTVVNALDDVRESSHTSSQGGAHGDAETPTTGRSDSALQQVTASLPALAEVEGATGVQKGPKYDQDMADLRQFYAEQEREAQHAKVNKGQVNEGPYSWSYGNRAYTFSHGVVSVEVRVYLDGANVSAAEVQRLKSQVHAGIDHHYNSKKLMVRGPDGVESQLHLEAIFVDDPALSDLQVMVLPGDGRAFLDTWYVDGAPTTHTHEVTHGAFGIKDEYVDPSAPGREHSNSPGVHNDQSIMGDYWTYDPARGQVADPRTAVKQRHLDEIGKQVPAAPPKPAVRPTTEEQARGNEQPPGAVGETRTVNETVAPPKSPDTPSTTSERDQFIEERTERAKAVESKVSPDKATVVREVEGLAAESEWQFEAGQRVGDPLFGASASNALKRAASAHSQDAAASTSIRNVGDLSKRLQRRMLDILRNPDLDVTTRRAELLSVISELERAIRASESMFPSDVDVASAFRFGEARAAVNRSIDDTFDKKLLMDDRGDVYRGAARIGSFRELMDQVVVANRALVEAGDPHQLVIVDSATANGKREILVLSRERPQGGESRGGTELPVQAHPDPNAVVVDVGTGLSSFALDLLQAEDRQGGPVVQTEHGESIVDGSRTRRDLTWKAAVPRTDADSVTVFGDPLANMDTLFGEGGVKRVFINNVNASYSPAQYAKLARVLLHAMASEGRVEVQWTNAPEYEGGEEGGRGHIDGYKLLGALESEAAATGRQVTSSRSTDNTTPDRDYGYSVRPSTRVGGVQAGKEVPTDPVPTDKVVILFGKRPTGEE